MSTAVTDDTTTDAQPREAIAAEVVDSAKEQKRAELARLDDEQRGDVERLADAGLAMPGMAGRDEFLSLAMQARMLSMSGAAPKLIRGNPHIALHICMIGRDLGISASAAVELIDVIETQQGPRPSMSPQLLNGQLRRLGLGSVRPLVQMETMCVAVALEPGGVIDMHCRKASTAAGEIVHEDGCRCDGWIGETEFTWREAQLAGLVGTTCTPDIHDKKPTQNGGARCGCNFGYMTYPKRMMWWRASGFCVDDYFPEAGLGLYTAEELGSMVDPEGRAIDASSVELPPGYEPTAEQRPAQRAATGEVDEIDIASMDDRWALLERIHAMPPEGQTLLKERMTGMARLKGVKVATLPGDLVNLVKSMLSGIEAGLKKDGYDAEAALQSLREREASVIVGLLQGGCAAVSAQEAPEPTNDADAATDDPGGTGDDPAVREDNSASDAAVIHDSDPETLRLTIETVKKMKPAALYAALVARDLSTDGNPDSRRHRLVVALLREQTEGTTPVEG